MNNTVELIGYYGSDEVIACSAWTSTSRNLTEEKRGRIEGLINMLWSNGHETPFEKGIIHFLVNTDIATHIHLLKHRISNINAESARYKELKEDKYYVPYDWPFEWIEKLEDHTNKGLKLYHECIDSLTKNYSVKRKRAKETARFFRGYNTQIEADIMFNMRSFANFLKLRDSEHAQDEIREVAQKMVHCVKSIKKNPFKHTLKAIGY
jgi:flavin-dependent thymidylate synthase